MSGNYSEDQLATSTKEEMNDYTDLLINDLQDELDDPIKGALLPYKDFNEYDRDIDERLLNISEREEDKLNNDIDDIIEQSILNSQNSPRTSSPSQPRLSRSPSLSSYINSPVNLIKGSPIISSKISQPYSEEIILPVSKFSLPSKFVKNRELIEEEEQEEDENEEEEDEDDDNGQRMIESMIEEDEENFDDQESETEYERESEVSDVDSDVEDDISKFISKFGVSSSASKFVAPSSASKFGAPSSASKFAAPSSASKFATSKFAAPSSASKFATSKFDTPSSASKFAASSSTSKFGAPSSTSKFAAPSSASKFGAPSSASKFGTPSSVSKFSASSSVSKFGASEPQSKFSETKFREPIAVSASKGFDSTKQTIVEKVRRPRNKTISVLEPLNDILIDKSVPTVLELMTKNIYNKMNSDVQYDDLLFKRSTESEPIFNTRLFITNIIGNMNFEDTIFTAEAIIELGSMLTDRIWFQVRYSPSTEIILNMIVDLSPELSKYKSS